MELSPDLVKRRAKLRRLNTQYPLWPPTPVPQEQWPFRQLYLEKVYRSREFLIQVFEQGDVTRLSICRAELDDTGRFSDGISWDELQKLKNACGFTDAFAVELFPPQNDVVNVANFRHLWIVPGSLLPFAWTKGNPCPGNVILTRP